MALLKDTLISSDIYNNLPYIGDVSHAPEERSADLDALRELLSKRHVPRGVSLRLVHKHFDTGVGEVVVFKNATIYTGAVQLMGPVDTAQKV